MHQPGSSIIGHCVPRRVRLRLSDKRLQRLVGYRCYSIYLQTLTLAHKTQQFAGPGVRCQIAAMLRCCRRTVPGGALRLEIAARMRVG